MTTTNDPAVAPSTPGAMLAKARRDLGLSQEEVASRLHLSPRQVAAIETDDYSQLPGTTYVRGYLRSYAELAGLASAPLIEAFNRQTAAAPAVRYDAIATPKEVTSQHHQMQLVTYVIAAVVIGLLAAWWFGRDASKPVTTQLPAGVTIEQAPLQPAIDPQAAASAAAPATAPVAASVPAPAVAPAVPKPAAPVPAQPANAGVVTAPAPVVVPAPPPPVAAAPAPRARIVLHASEESWADVRDAQQNRLIYETVPAGRTVTLEGVAPLQVYLGNAGGVTIEANGQALDLTRYRRGTVARFTVEAPTVGSR